jgi:hypothetical protein
MSYASDFVKALSPALFELGEHKVAVGTQGYMKDIAPFKGVATPERRPTVKKIAKSLQPR